MDVDRTLIMWESGDLWHPHLAHIEILKQFKFQGHGVIVWSAGGHEWALKAIKLLGIEELVDLVAGKPDWWMDDRSCTEFMPELTRIYLTDDNEKQ